MLFRSGVLKLYQELGTGKKKGLATLPLSSTRSQRYAKQQFELPWGIFADVYIGGKIVHQFGPMQWRPQTVEIIYDEEGRQKILKTFSPKNGTTYLYDRLAPIPIK